MRTNIDGVLLANTTQIINSNLNNNAMVKIAHRAVNLALGGRVSVPAPLASLTEQPTAEGFTSDVSSVVSKEHEGHRDPMARQ